MFPHSQRSCVNSESAGHLGGLQPLDVEQAKQVSIIGPHLLERVTYLRSTRPVDQAGQRIVFFAAHDRLRALEAAESACLAVRAPSVMQADVASGLKDKGRQGVEVLHAIFPQSFQHPTDRLLGHIVGLIAVAQAPRGEQAKPQPEAFRQLRGKRVGRSIGSCAQDLAILSLDDGLDKRERCNG